MPKRKFENKTECCNITECCNKKISNDIIHNWGIYKFNNKCIYCHSITIIDKDTIHFIEQCNQNYENRLMENEDVNIHPQLCSET